MTNISALPAARLRHQALPWLVAIVAVAIALRLLTFVGVVGSDDIAISNLAERLLATGPWVPENHYQGRIGLIYPLALIYGGFGVGEWQLVALPFIAGIASVLLAYGIAAELVDVRAGLLAALTIAVFPLDVSGATQMMPDLPLGALLGAAFYFALMALSSDRPVRWSVASGLAWGLAYLAKEEAAFLLVPMALLFLANLRQWQRLIWAFAVCGAIVAAESLVYWLAGGEILHRVHAIQNQGDLAVTDEYGAGQLWVFPKSWFITFYEFGLHYYLLFAAMIWVAVARVRVLYIVVAWALAYLLWLQFGGNPFSENYSVKSHLDRYCSMLSVPMAVLVGAMLARALVKVPRLGMGLTAAMVAAGLFFIAFNTLSNERQEATKVAIDFAREHDLFPLYMDRTSYLMAGVYMRGDPRLDQTHALQQYDFAAHKMENLDVSRLDGYALLNRGFMDYAWNRYQMDKVALDRSSVREVYRVDNPGRPLAYAQARLLYGISRLIPVAFLREKIGGTAETLLQGGDVIVVEPVAPSSAAGG